MSIVMRQLRYFWGYWRKELGCCYRGFGRMIDWQVRTKYHLDRIVSIPSVPSVEVGCGIGIAMLAVAVVVIWRLQLTHLTFGHQPFFFEWICREVHLGFGG